MTYHPKMHREPKATVPLKCQSTNLPRIQLFRDNSGDIIIHIKVSAADDPSKNAKMVDPLPLKSSMNLTSFPGSPRGLIRDTWSTNAFSHASHQTAR